MPVNNPLPSNLPVSTIGLPKGNSRPMRAEDTLTKVTDPATGKVYEMSRSNARDKVRIDGWTMAVDKAPPQPAEAVAKEEPKVDDDIGEFDTMEDKKEPTELDLLRKEYEDVSGKEADKRWGKSALQNRIELAKSPPVAEETDD